MHAHPAFDGLLIADDADLAAALGSPPVARRVVHEWPLTRTEQVRLADGRRLAVKTQLPPTVEPAFYRRASGSVLLPGIDLGKLGTCSWNAIEWLDAPALASVEEPDRYTALARAAADGIAAIRAADADPLGATADALPVHLDLGAEHWDAVVDDVASGLADLVASNRFAQVRADEVGALRDWASSAAVRVAVEAEPVLAHGDLFPDEVLLPGDGGIRALDWQRPVLGPAGMDLAGLLRRAPGGPLPREPLPDAMLSFVELHWAVTAIRDILPGLPPALPDGWARAALDRILAGSS